MLMELIRLFLISSWKATGVSSLEMQYYDGLALERKKNQFIVISHVDFNSIKVPVLSLGKNSSKKGLKDS